MLSSLLPLLASFFKVLPLPQKFIRFHRFRFHIFGLDPPLFMNAYVRLFWSAVLR